MNKAFEKILEELHGDCWLTTNDDGETNELSIAVVSLDDAMKIVQEVAEEYKDGWIPVSSGILPDIAINPVTNDYVRYNVTYQNGDIVDTRNYAYGEAAGGKHWLNGGQIMDKYVTAWQPLPKSYQPNICADTDCPYNDGNECPAADGCAGYEKSDWKSNIMNRFMEG